MVSFRVKVGKKTIKSGLTEAEAGVFAGQHEGRFPEDRGRTRIERAPTPTPIPPSGGFQITVTERGGGRTPQTVSVVKTFGTKREAEDFLQEKRFQIADRETPVGIRPTPSPEALAAIPKFQGREITGPPPSERGRQLQRERLGRQAIEKAGKGIPISAAERAAFRRTRFIVGKTKERKDIIKTGAQLGIQTPAETARLQKAIREKKAPIRFTVIDIDLETGSGGRGRVETPVKEFTSKTAAETFLKARRKEQGQREIPSFIRQSKDAVSTRVTQPRAELKEQLRRKEDASRIKKEKQLARQAQQKAAASIPISAAERAAFRRTRFIVGKTKERKDIIKTGAQLGIQTPAETARLQKAIREKKAPITRLQLEKEKAEARQERALKLTEKIRGKGGVIPTTVKFSPKAFERAKVALYQPTQLLTEKELTETVRTRLEAPRTAKIVPDLKPIQQLEKPKEKILVPLTKPKGLKVTAPSPTTRAQKKITPPLKIRTDVPLSLTGIPGRLELQPTTIFGKYRKFESDLTRPLVESKLFKVRKELVDIQIKALRGELRGQTGLRRTLTKTSLLGVGVGKGVFKVVTEYPVSAALTFGAALGYGIVAKLISGASTLGKASVITTEAVLGTKFVVGTGVAISQTPTMVGKGELIGEATVGTTAVIGGAKLGGGIVTIAKRPRLIDLNLAEGRLRTVTVADGTFKTRELDISGLTNLFGKRGKQPRTIFEDATPPPTTNLLPQPKSSTFFTASTISPAETLAAGKTLFAFRTKELAEGRAIKEKEGKVFEFKSSDFQVDIFPGAKTPKVFARPIPKEGGGFKTITSTEPEFIIRSLTQEKPVSREPTLKEKAKLTVGVITSTVIGTGAVQPIVTTLGGAALVGLTVPAFTPISFVFGASRATRRFQPRKKQAARKSRIERLQKQQQQQTRNRLFEETRILQKGKQRIIETQKFQPFLDIRKGEKGRVIETLTKIPKGQPERIFLEKGKPFFIKEKAGKVEILPIEGKKGKTLIDIGVGGIKGIKDIPTGKKAFPKGFGGQILRPAGHQQLTQKTIGKPFLLIKGVGKTTQKVTKSKQPIIKESIRKVTPILLEPKPTKELSPLPISQPEQRLRGGFRKGQKQKILGRIQEKEAARRLVLEQQSLPKTISQATSQHYQGITSIFSRKKKKKISLPSFETEVILRGQKPITIGELPKGLPSDIFLSPSGEVGTARKLRTGQIPFADTAAGQRLGLETDLGVKQSQLTSPILALATQQALGLKQDQGVISLTDTSLDQLPSTDIIQGQQQKQIISQEPIHDSIISPDIFKPIFPLIPIIPPRKPPRIPPRKPPRIIPPRIGPPRLPPRIPPRKPPKEPPRRPIILILKARSQEKPTFNVLVREGERRADKFKTVGKNLPRNKAINLGRGIVDNFVEASFRIKPTGKKTLIPDTFPQTLPKFRRPRKGTKLPGDTFIEKRKFRIDSGGEKLGLAFFKRKKQARV